jgi:putative aminopeptidase FrvX
MKSLIKKLVETAGPSGYESLIRAVIREEVEPLVDEVRVDNLGNLIARKGLGLSEEIQAAPQSKIMLSAHIDEIGLITSHIDDHGFVRFIPIGGVRPHTCPGGRVRFLNDVEGVIGVERLMNAPRAQPTNAIPGFEQMYIDVGVSSRKECPLSVGEMAVFDRPFLDLGKRLVSKAMDDRIGAAILIETLRQLGKQSISLPHQLFFVFSVQEEVGLRGAMTAAFGVDPDIGLAVDVTACGDTPRGDKMEVGLGKGPAIKVRDEGMLADPRIVEWMVETAKRAGIPYQMEILVGGTTDARSIQLTRAGVPAGCLSIPCRYIHSPSEMVDNADVLDAVKLLVELLSTPIKFLNDSLS